jgi:hypothetical protein
MLCCANTRHHIPDAYSTATWSNHSRCRSRETCCVLQQHWIKRNLGEIQFSRACFESKKNPIEHAENPIAMVMDK